MPTSPTSGPGGGGGGGLSAASAAYLGSNVNIINSASANLTWNSLLNGTDLFDRTDPAHPAVLVSGLYIAAVNIFSEALTVGGSYAVGLVLDANGASIELDAEGSASLDPNRTPLVSLCAAYHVPATSTIEVYVKNNDGAAARNFRIISAAVVLLS